MAQQRQQYDSVYKQKAVELADARGNVREVAEELGISPNLIYRWRSELKAYGSGSFPGNGRL
jgi:transposase